MCLDEKPVVLHADVHPSIPVEPGHPERVDYEYERQGTRNLFVMVEPLAGWRHVEVTAQRTRPRLPHSTRPFRQRKHVAFCNGLSFISPAIHGSWLNMAEIEIALLERNALSRRLESEAALCRQVMAVETERNTQRCRIAWQFTSRDARHKLSRLYPVKEPVSS